MYLRCVLILICAIPHLGAALTFSPEEAVEYALQHNPSLAAERLRADEARGRLRQSGHLSNPELELGASRHATGREGEVEAGLTQKIPVTRRLVFEKARRRAELAAIEADIHEVERKLARDVRIVAVKWIAAQDQLALLRTQQGTSEELANFLSTRVETGEASPADALQVELESAEANLAAVELEAEQTELQSQLQSLLGVEPGTQVQIKGSLPSANVTERSSGARPDLEAAQRRVEAAHYELRTQQSQRWEDIGLTVAYTRERSEDAPEGLETEHAAQVRLSIPLPLWNRNEGGIQEAAAGAARARKEAEALASDAAHEARAASALMQTHARTLRDLDTVLLPKAEQVVEQLQTSYESGQVPLPDVLRARAKLLDLKARRIRTLRDFHVARITHMSAAGTTMEAAK